MLQEPEKPQKSPESTTLETPTNTPPGSIPPTTFSAAAQPDSTTLTSTGNPDDLTVLSSATSNPNATTLGPVNPVGTTLTTKAPNPSVGIPDSKKPSAEIKDPLDPLRTLPNEKSDVKSLDQNGHDWFAAFVAALQAVGAINQSLGKRRGDKKRVRYETAALLLTHTKGDLSKLASIDWSKKPYNQTSKQDIRKIISATEAIKTELGRGKIRSTVGRWTSTTSRKKMLQELTNFSLDHSTPESKIKRIKSLPKTNEAILKARQQKPYTFYLSPWNNYKIFRLEHDQKKLDAIAERAGLNSQELRDLKIQKTSEQLDTRKQREEKSPSIFNRRRIRQLEKAQQKLAALAAEPTEKTMPTTKKSKLPITPALDQQKKTSRFSLRQLFPPKPAPTANPDPEKQKKKRKSAKR